MTTLTETVIDDIRSRIADKRLATGARLPSIRTFADAMGVSKTTVVEAYQRLAAAGAVVPRRGSGFYVTEPHAVPARLEPPRPERAIDSFWLTYQAREAGPEMLKPGSGWLPDDWMPQGAIQAALRDLARKPEVDRVGYDGPLGFAPLRDQIARRLAQRGTACRPEQIVLADAATQGLDLACRMLLSPGDAVLIDDPCYFNFHATLAAHGVRVVPIPFTPDGPDLAAFAAAAATYRPRLYLTNSGCHNPTGAMLAPGTAYQLLRLVEEHDMAVIEDDVYADLEHETAPRLSAYDGLRRVICVGSFSKTVSASIRCGFLAVAPALVEALVQLKLATSFGNSQLAATLVHRVLLDGSYRRHIEALRTKLAGAMTLTLRRLREAGLESWHEPRAGMFVWARLPGDNDAAWLARRILDENIVLAPGEIFSRSEACKAYMRFNVSRCAQPSIFEAIRRIVSDRPDRS